MENHLSINLHLNKIAGSLSFLLTLAACIFFYPVKSEASYSSLFYPADSIIQTLILKKNGVIVKSISIGQQLAVKPFNAFRISGTLNEINSEFLVVNQTKIPISIIDWIKVRKKKKNKVHPAIKGLGILIGIAFSAYAALVFGLGIAYSSGGGTDSIFFGILIVGGLILLLANLLSGRKYKVQKHDLEFR